DVSRLIYSLANPKRRVIGLISGLPIEGGFTMDPQTRQPRQTPPWRIIDELKQTYTVRGLGAPSEIASDEDGLLVVPPKNLNDATKYAIDQCLMRGGKMIAFVDPVCENDESGQQFAMGADRGSSLAWLLDGWGVEVPPDKLAADLDL